MSETKPETTHQEEEQKKETRPHDPSRFENYQLLEDQTGFKLVGSDHIYYFDSDGGWYDEFDNYYNKDAEPAEPPVDDDDDDDNEEIEGEHDDDDDDEDEDDEYDEEYGEDEEQEDKDLYELEKKLLGDYDVGGDEEEDDDYKYGHTDDQSHYENIENNRRLEDYEDNDYVRIDFTNISHKKTVKDFKEFLDRHGAKVSKLYFSRYQKDLASATFKGKKNALEALNLNGKQFDGRPILVTVRTQNKEYAEDAVANSKSKSHAKKEESKAAATEEKVPTKKNDDFFAN